MNGPLASKRFLVTGGCGFIGSNLCLDLQDKGAEVVAVDNTQSGIAENLLGSGIRFIQADVTASETWKNPEILEVNWDAIFHHGDITDPRHGDDAVVYERNVGGFSNVLNLARTQMCRLVFASTAGLYGNGPVPMREDQPNHILTAYGKSKEEMERLAALAGKEIPVVGLRYFNVYGPREGHKGRAASMIFHLFHQMRAGKRPRLFEFGEQKRDFVYVKDVVSANLCALRAPSGIYNVGSGSGEEFNAVVHALNAAMGTQLETEYFPISYDPSTYQSNTQADLHRAETTLGYRSEWSLAAGVKDYVRWLEKPADRPVVSSRTL